MILCVSQCRANQSCNLFLLYVAIDTQLPNKNILNNIVKISKATEVTMATNDTNHMKFIFREFSQIIYNNLVFLYFRFLFYASFLVGHSFGPIHVVALGDFGYFVVSSNNSLSTPST